MTTHPLSNRVEKLQKHLQKWAKNKNITCYRIYDRDMIEYPVILDWYNGEAVTWLYERTRDETEAQKQAFRTEVLEAIYAGLQIPKEKLFIKERKPQKGLQQQYTKLGEQKALRIVQEAGLSFEVNLSDYLDTGLFLDHRKTREIVRSLSKQKSVLNLFAYTGSFTCYALAGGASKTTTIDLNPNYSDWTRRNLVLNDFAENAPNQIITQDCRYFLKKQAFNQKFDIIICDPPTFSNTKRGQKSTFSVDLEYPDLIKNCADILNPGGIIFFSTNSLKFKLDQKLLPSNLKIADITHQTIPEDFRNKRIHRCWKISQLN